MKVGLRATSVELETIGVTGLEGQVVKFVHFPTRKDKRLIAELRDGSRRVIQCDKCGKTNSLEARPNSPRFTNYLILCRNDSTRLFLTIIRDNQE
jgi:hypothetical protein